MWFFTLLILGGVFLTAGIAPADIGTAETLIRDAQKLYFNGKATEADNMLQQAEDLISRAMTGGDSAAAARARGLDGKARKLRKDIDRKLGKTAGTVFASPSPAKAPAVGATGGMAMPSFVASRLKGVNSSIENGRGWLAKGSVRTARRSLDRALEQMREIEEKYGGKYPPDHQDAVATKEHLQSFENMVADAEAREGARKAEAGMKAEQAAKESAVWKDRLKPYVTGMGQPGYDPKRYFIGSFTGDDEEMGRRAALYTEVQTRMESYRTEGPGEDGTDELKEIARQLEYQIESFAGSLQGAGETYLREALTQIDFLLRRSSEESAKIGTGTPPLPMDKDVIGRSKKLLDRASKILGVDDAGVSDAEGKYARILEMDGKIRKARLAETRMSPDKFTGKGADEIRDKAQGILAEKKPGVRILRTSIVSPDWIEERVTEWTDTTRTALRYRVTWYVTAQVAGKGGDEAKIYTIHVARDRRSDGSWSPLYGHIMYEDAILAENVNR